MEALPVATHHLTRPLSVRAGKEPVRRSASANHPVDRASAARQIEDRC
jgi:hypothetical protein